MSTMNRLRLTWISFLSFGLTGALIVVTGIVMNSVADFFHIPLASMGNTFTFLNTGILVAIFLNAWLVHIISLKRQLSIGFVLMLFSVVGLMFSKGLMLFSLCMFILGVVSGITMSIGTFLITQLYHGRRRGSMLLITDSFFSMAGMIFPVAAGYILASHAAWYWVYALIGVVYLAIYLLTMTSEFPPLHKNDSDGNAVISSERWGTGVFVIAAAALCYILGQMIFISWLPDYVSTQFSMSVEKAGALVGSFWMAYMIGMWIFSVIVRFFDLYRLVLSLTLLAALAMYVFIGDNSGHYLHISIIALGFVSSAIYTSLITLGSQQTKVSSPRLVNFILTSGTVGTMLTFVVSSPIIHHYGPKVALWSANGLYAAVFVLTALLALFTQHRNHGHV
ncbi:MFS transporter TsgA [Plesiomonas shigelloides]|uniref:MFS transporter TsgA n=1 Tax=Plesiomonas shigelloides TaxID=703 RepID=UPI003260F224